jgi:Flp pilus assembly protein TadD
MTDESNEISLANALGLEQAHVDLMLEMHRLQLSAGRLKDAWETLDVLTTLCPFDAKPWRLMAETERRRGREDQAALCEEVASWCE